MNIDDTKKQIKDDAFWQDMEIASGETTRIPVEDIRRFASAHATDNTHIPDASRKSNLTKQNFPDNFRSDDMTNRHSSDASHSDSITDRYSSNTSISNNMTNRHSSDAFNSDSMADRYSPDASYSNGMTDMHSSDASTADNMTNRIFSDTANSDRATSTDAPSNFRYVSDVTGKKADIHASAQSTQNPKNSGSKKSDSKKSGSKKSKKKGSGLTSLVKFSAKFTQKTVSTGGSLLKGSARLSGTVARSGFRLVTLALILLTMALLGFHFWKNYSALGSLRSMLSERNYSLAAYLCVGILLILFELAALLRAATSKKIRDGKRIFTYDTGRGMFSFPIIYAGSCLALRFCERIPMLHPALSGVQSALRVYGSLSQTLLAIGCLGVVSCLLRWGFSRVLLSVRNHDDD